MAAPTVLLTEDIGLTNIDNAEDSGLWNGFRHSGGGTPSPQDEGDVFREGTQAVSIKASGANRDEGIWFDVGVTTIDMTVVGRHLYIWMAVTTASQLDAIAAGGMYIIVASDASGNNWNKYYVGGSDVTDSSFQRFVIDLTKTPSETAGTAATLTTIRWFGIGIKSVSLSAKSENVIVDRVDYGNGLAIEDGDSTTPCSWEELFAADAANAYGIIEKRGGVYFLKGGIQFGDSSGVKTSLWLDASGAIVIFENPTYYNGTAIVSAVDGPNLYKFIIVGNGTGTTDFTLGSVVGSGDDRQGLQGGLIGTNGQQWTFDGETDIADVDSVNFFGVTFQGAGITSFSSATKTDVIGCTFVNCDEIEANTVEFLNNTIIAPVPDRGIEIVDTTGVKQINFIAGDTGEFNATRVWQVDESITPDAFVEFTSEAASVATGDVDPFPASEANDDYFCIGADSKFESLSVDVGTAGDTGVLIWEYWTGAAWTALAGVTDNTTSFTSSGVNTVVWTDDTNDWASVSLNGERPLYYVRARITTTYGTDPILDEIHPVDKMEHHVHFPSATGSPFSGNAWNFFGFAPDGAPKWHGENNSGTSLTISASVSNISENDFEDVGASSTTIDNDVAVTLTGMLDNTEIRVYAAGTVTPELAGVEDATDGSTDNRSFTFSLAAALNVDINVLHKDRALNTYFSLIIPADPASIPVFQQIDRIYSNP